MKNRLRSITKTVLDHFSLEIRRKNPTVARPTLRGTLEHAKKLGFNPQSVIDVGAATGTFALYETFPEARHLLIEPLEENRAHLEKVVAGLKNAEYIIAAATKETGTVTFNVHADFDGSSLYSECEDTDVNGVPRTVPAVMLDNLYEDRRLQGPVLIKIDVQGAELDVLRGASKLLDITEYVVLETSLFCFFVGGPQFYDVVSFMKERGFVVYDILEYSYRLLDGAMSQVDLVFVKEDGFFRKHHFYATKEQREAQNKLLTANRAAGS
jgi:FkbM family methyltransferase